MNMIYRIGALKSCSSCKSCQEIVRYTSLANAREIEDPPKEDWQWSSFIAGFSEACIQKTGPVASAAENPISIRAACGNGR
jgi:hypothetical protein